jgi:hypothetical protein
MPRAPNDDPPEIDQEAIAILEQVKLVSFAAEPATIQPFASSTLRWAVHGPEGEFTLKLDSHVVDSSGTLAVHPHATHSYSLSAKANDTTKHLGSTTVHVDTSACETIDIPLQKTLWDSALKVYVATHPPLRFQTLYRITRDPLGHIIRTPIGEHLPEVSVSGDHVDFKLYLLYGVAKFPDPTVNIDASFRATVGGDGNPLAVFSRLDIHVHFQPHAWVLPGAVSYLPVVTSQLVSSKKKDLDEGITAHLAQMIADNLPKDRPRRVLSAAFVPPTPGELGTLRVVHCPPP